MTRRSDEPHPPFTVVELEIAELAGKGYGHARIANALGRKVSTIRSCVFRMAAKLTHEDGVKPLARVQLWAAHRTWLARQPATPPKAA